jgi:hypothetical protein
MVKGLSKKTEENAGAGCLTTMPMPALLEKKEDCRQHFAAELMIVSRCLACRPASLGTGYYYPVPRAGDWQLSHTGLG